MPGFSYLSILNPGFTSTVATTGVGADFAYVQFINPPAAAGATASGGAAASYFQNANNVSFGTAGSVVTATASFAGTFTTYRSNAWSNMGVWVGTGSPGSGIVYSDWSGGAAGYWLWLRIP